MGNTVSCTFGLPIRVSCGKFRIISFSRLCLLCLMFGLFTLGSLSAQGPGGGSPGEGDRGRERGSRGGGFGGRGGFDPAQMISGLDKDGDGVISASEAEQIDRRMRDRMQQNGMDFSKGVRVQEMQQSIQRRMEERGSGGPSESDPRRDREGEFQRSDRQENPTPSPPPQDLGPGFGRDGRGDNRGNTSPGGSTPLIPGKSGSGSTSKKGGTRISPLLPDTYKVLDTDYDGQIALYEWRNGKRGTISQFVQNDFDGDGFLIAKELSKAVITAPATRPIPGAAPATAAVTPAPVAPAASPAPVAVSVNTAMEAARAFELLDVDKSGTVVGPEWNKSVRLKPLFEKGGVNLTQPLNLDAFTQAYVRVGAAK
jgi:EF hand